MPNVAIDAAVKGRADANQRSNGTPSVDGAVAVEGRDRSGDGSGENGGDNSGDFVGVDIDDGVRDTTDERERAIGNCGVVGASTCGGVVAT